MAPFLLIMKPIIVPQFVLLRQMNLHCTLPPFIISLSLLSTKTNTSIGTSTFLELSKPLQGTNHLFHSTSLYLYMCHNLILPFTSTKIAMEDWELLPDNLPRESYFNPTGLFEPDYFTPHESTQTTDATEEIVEEKIEPPIAIAGGDVIFDVVFEQEDEDAVYSGDSDECDSSESLSFAEDKSVEEETRPTASALARAQSWVLRGAGALCSFGIAAAALLVIMDGKHQKRQMQQKLCFEIRTDDKKKINNKLIEEKAKSGDGTNRAEIKFGGV